LENKPLYTSTARAVSVVLLDIFGPGRKTEATKLAVNPMGSVPPDDSPNRSSCGHRTGHTCPPEAYPVATSYNHGYASMSCVKSHAAREGGIGLRAVVEQQSKTDRPIHRLSISYETGHSYGSHALAAQGKNNSMQVLTARDRTNLKSPERFSRVGLWGTAHHLRG
jgi:hypothetical protein